MIRAEPYRPRPNKTMLTAKASGTVCIDGEWIDIRAGLDRVEAGHPIINARPELFGLESTRSPAPAKTARPKTKVSLVRDRTPRFEVELTPDLVCSIEEEIRETLGTYGIVETGGYLVSHRLDYIGIQTGPGPKSTHAAHRFQLDDSAAGRWLDSDPLLRIVGDWHLHPGDDDGVPSDHDVRGLAGHTTLPMSHYVGIVATKGEIGFTTPELHGWVAFYDGDTAVCEPARLTGW